MAPLMLSRWMQPATLLLCVALLGVLLTRGLIPALSRVGTDFPNYLTAARIVADGHAAERLYDDVWFQEQMRGYAIGIPAEGKFAPFPPPTALLLLPLARLEPLTALRVVTLVSVLALLCSVVLLHRILGWSPLQATIFVLLSGYAVLNALRLGQPYILVSLSCIAGYYFRLKRRPLLAGVCFGLFVPIKYYPIVFLLYFACRREWRLVTGGALAMTAVAVLSVAVLGWKVHGIFLAQVLGEHLTGRLSLQSPFATSFQSFDVLFRQLLVFDPVYNPWPMFTRPDLQPVAVAATKIVILAACVVTLLRVARAGRDHATELSLGIIGIATLLLAPATATYHFVLLWLPVGLIIRALAQHSRLQATVMLALYAFIGCLPYGHTSQFAGHGALSAFAFPRLFLLLVMLALAIRWGAVVASPLRSGRWWDAGHLWAAGALAALGSLAFIRLMALPAFEDEGSQLRLIRRAIDAGEWLQPLRDGKPLETWLMVPLFLAGSPPLAAIRAFHVLVGIVGILLIYRLCLGLVQRRVAFACATVFACCPFAVYLQRLALSDILMTTAGVWVLLALLSLLRNPTRGSLFSLGLALFLGAMCKLPVAFVLLLPVALALLLMPALERRTLLQSWPQLAAAMTPTVLLAVLIVAIALGEARRGQPLAFGIQDFLGLGAGSYGDVAQVMGTVRPTLLGELNAQIPWPVTLLTAVGLISAAFGSDWRQRWLIATGLIPLLLIGLGAHFWFSRYLLFTLPPLFIASVCGWWRLCEHAGRYRNCVGAAVLLAVIAPMERQSLRLIFEPLHARWSPVDRFQYVEGWSSGYGYPEAARYLLAQTAPRTTVFALDGHSAEQLLTYLPADRGNTVIPIFYGPQGQALPTQTERQRNLRQALELSPQGVLILVAPQLLPRYLESTFGAAGARQLLLQPRAQFDKPGGRSQIAFYLVTGRN